MAKRTLHYDASVRPEALALSDSGLGAVEIARRLGLPYGTAKDWVQPGNRRAREARAQPALSL